MTTRRAVWMIDPVGGHRGMHYYDFALCGALEKNGRQVTLFTCDETAAHQPASDLPVEYPFQRIFGAAPAPLRGIRYITALKRILARMAQRPPAILHLHYLLLGPADLWFLKQVRRMRTKVVLTVHDVIPFNAAAHTRMLYAALYRNVDGFVVHTEHSRQELLATFAIEPERVAVIPHGHYLAYVETTLPSREEARHRLDIPLDAKVVLFFGQIKQVKGLDTLLEAMPAVIEAHPETILVVAGTVWKDTWKPYADLIARLGIAGHMRARIELIPDEDVVYYFRSADVVALPYRRIYQSGVLLMAYSYARPVVATAVGGLAETVLDGVTGWLVPPDDPAALSARLTEALAQPERTAAMGEQARSVVESDYDWNKIAAKTAAFYDKISEEL